jgi:glycosyltransferase involved in cell wall biosynthesis
MYPTTEHPAYGTFVRTQEHSLRAAGVDVEVHVIGRGYRGQSAFSGVRKYAGAVPAVRAHVRRERVDLVHAHYSYPALIALASRTVPVVVTFHGDDALGTIGPRGRTTLRSRALVVPASRWVVRHAAAVVVQTEQMADALQRPDARVIPCEVDFDVFHPVDRAAARARLGLDPSKRYLLFAANPEIAVKNHPFAVAVTERVRTTCSDVELLVVYREPQPRLALYMNAADVLVFPSYQEGSPNIVKQALACDLPVVANDVGDVRSVVGDAPNCAVVGLDLDRFSAAVSSTLRTRWRTFGRPHVAQFAPETVAASLISLYDDVLHASRRSVGAR